MRDVLDLDRYPLDRPDSAELAGPVRHCQAELAANGTFNVDGSVRAHAIAAAVAELEPLSARTSHNQRRRHNVYFAERVPGAAPDHPALALLETHHHALCDDQLAGSIVQRIYEWAPIPAFLARVMRKPALFLMKEPLARANVMEYRHGEGLGWHFDRSQFTTTLPLQSAEHGGEFEYRSDLRTDVDPNYDAVALVLRGEDPALRVARLAAGALNVSAGRNTLHRVSPVRGSGVG